MKALPCFLLILLSGIWMLGGCVQAGPGHGPRTVAPPVHGHHTPDARNVSAPGEPAVALHQLGRAVEASDFEGVLALFAPPYRTTLQQWAADTGQGDVMETLRMGLHASREGSMLYTLVRYARPGDVRWETRVPDWERARPLVVDYLADSRVTRVEIEHRGFLFGLYGGAWLFERW